MPDSKKFSCIQPGINGLAPIKLEVDNIGDITNRYLQLAIDYLEKNCENTESSQLLMKLKAVQQLREKYGIKEVGNNLIGFSQRVSIADFKRITFEVINETRVSLKEIRSKMRNSLVVRARERLIVRLKDELCWSFPEIGRYIKKDHSTAAVAYHRHKKSIKNKTSQ